jgi:uncharacterized damage-inducible protein DinB
MHPRIQELTAYLNTGRTSLREAVEAVPAAMRNAAPGDNCWSVAQVLEHLTIVENRFTKTLGDKLAAARATGLGPETETSSILGSWDVASMLDRREKREAPEAVRPQGIDWNAALAQLDDARTRFLGVYQSGDGLALGSVIHSHPRFGDLNMYQWGVWLGSHEARHTEQIHEIAASLKSEV